MVIGLSPGGTALAAPGHDTHSVMLFDAAEPDQRYRVFEHFYQVDSSRSGGGHGLGLSIAASIAGAHGGSLKLAARDGGGLVAVLDLPREQ